MDKNKRNELIPLFMILALFIIVNVVWLWIFRHGQLLDIDEAGYFSYSLIDYHAFMDNGFIGWIKTVGSPSIQAPVTTALSSLAYVIFGPRLFVGFLMIVFFGVVTIVASYYLGKFIGGRRLGLFTCILVASCPIVINYARSYSFALPAAAVTTVALLALVRSERFVNIGWSMIFGVCLGLMPLTRTMSIAFIPGLLVPAILYVIVKSDDRARRAGVLILSLLVGAAVAATWLIPNGSLVWRYLTSFGYGSRTIEYAASHEVHGWLQNLISWPETFKYLGANVYLPDLILISSGIALLFGALLRLSFTKGWRGVGKDIMESKMLPVVFLVLEGVVAITSSQNKGTGFLLPLIPAMLLIFTWMAMQWSKSGKARNIIVGGIITVVAIASFTPLIYLIAPIAQPWVALSTTVVSGLGNIQNYEKDVGYHTQNPLVPIDSQTSKLWNDASLITAQKLTQLDGNYALIAFGFRNWIYNVNTVNLQQLLAGRKLLPLTQIEPIITGGSKEGYFEWLINGSASTAHVLVMTSEGLGDIFPTVNYEHLVEAAKEAGFSLVSNVLLPDARTVTFWERHLSTGTIVQH